MRRKLALSATMTAAAAATIAIGFAIDSLSGRTIAADSGRGDRVAITDNECKAATWPNIPKACLERTTPRAPLDQGDGWEMKAG